MPLALLFALTAGLAPSGKTIDVVSVPAGESGAPTVVLLAGLDGRPHPQAAREVDSYQALAPSHRRFHLLAVLNANPDGAALVFPPQGTAYRDHPESHYLWRWLVDHAPDLVLTAGADAGLLKAAPPGIPLRAFRTLSAVPAAIPPSEARRERERRIARSPHAVAEELARHYGNDLAQAVYIPATAVAARLRMGETEHAERLAAPYLSGERDSLAKPTGSHLSGHLLFAELAARTGKPGYVALVRKAADLAFAPDGSPLEAMPMHLEMSDSFFMGCPILAQAGKLTGEARYFDMAVRHYRFMARHCLRPDGLYRHSPLNEAAWGRGNGFAALGVVLTIEAMPRAHPGRAELIEGFRRHVAALVRWQNEDGLWRQVIDLPGVYPEFTATAQIAAAMLKGVRNGWLEAAGSQPSIERAWRAANARIGSDGVLLDVCEGTGKMPRPEDYPRRAAIWGRDPRGGAMALLFAVEMAGMQ